MGRIHNIEGRKNKQDAARSNVFTKHARAIAVAAREGGGDPEYNASLKAAIVKAKSDNMPNDNIDRAIKKGVGGGDGENYESITYEGYGAGGVAIIVETLTDNKNRTAGNVRYYFDKNNGNLGTPGCVSFMFDRKGQIFISNENAEEEQLMEEALELGAEDFIPDEDGFDIVRHISAGLDADDTAALLGHGGMNQLDELLGLACAVVAHNQSNHKRSLLLHICIPYHNSTEMAMGKYTVFYRPSFSRRALPMSS